MLVKRKWTSRGIIEIRFASYWREINELISIRTQIYTNVGKHQKPQPMTDEWDKHSIIIGIYLNDKPVASARVIDCNPEAEWEHDRFLTWHDGLPPRSDCVEISRFCVERKHRNWTVISALGEGLGYAMLRLKKNYAVACCTDELRKFYLDFFGVKFTGDVIEHCDLGEKPHYIFTNDISEKLRGESIEFLKWCSMWPGVLTDGFHLIKDKPTTFKLAMSLRLIAGLIIQPFINCYIDHFAKRSR